MSVIVLTGGGTAGHVTPNLALIKALQAEGWRTHYIGSPTGPEASMVSGLDCAFHPIASGKLRRYFSWQNFVDPFKSLYGIWQAWRALGKCKAEVVFSKGGFVAFPVVVAAWMRRIPVVAHESDFSPGLANRLSYPFVKKICLTFEGAKKYFANTAKTEVTGTPIRDGLDDGVKAKGLDYCGFDNQRPVLMMIGGSQGAQRLNEILRQALPDLLQQYQVIHICGPGNVDTSLDAREGYQQFEFVQTELADLFAATDVVISRAGANAVYELLALHKPHILIPLPMNASRGDQIENANYFAEKGASKVLDETQVTADTLIKAVQDLEGQQDTVLNAMRSLNIQSATPTLVRIIKEQVGDESAVYSK